MINPFKNFNWFQSQKHDPTVIKNAFIDLANSIGKVIADEIKNDLQQKIDAAINKAMDARIKNVATAEQLNLITKNQLETLVQNAVNKQELQNLKNQWTTQGELKKMMEDILNGIPDYRQVKAGKKNFSLN
jgi:hypothetical protein